MTLLTKRIHRLRKHGGPDWIPCDATENSHVSTKDLTCCSEDGRPHVPQPRPGTAKETPRSPDLHRTD